MSSHLEEKYPHLQFRQHWTLTPAVQFLLGQCVAYVDAISNTPILPQQAQRLMQVSLIRGAQATTAIEGNTLTDEEIERVKAGDHISPSKQYQEIEVRNILEAFNVLGREVLDHDLGSLVTPELVRRFHWLVGKDLGPHLDAIPGQWRTDARIVGSYRCPDHADVPALMERFSTWLRETFGYEHGQSFPQGILQAILAHVYLEWIHPFGDGNGRTGRLLEFYLMLRAGTPDIASHILSNHYNQTRSEYYRQLDHARHTRDLTAFLEYALVGFQDGLQQTLQVIQQGQFEIIWRQHVYDQFTEHPGASQAVLKRRRMLALQMPQDRGVTVEELPWLTPNLARTYGGVSTRTLLRDLDDLFQRNLVVRLGRKYYANTSEIQKLTAHRKR
jgi:Fic family protein